MAKAKGVTCGAHPGFADKENFGRKELDLPVEQIQQQVREQLNAIQKIADEENVKLKYVKLHGALANMAARDYALALALFQIVKNHNPRLAILALDNSAQLKAAKQLGQRIIREAYADRAYTNDGLLLSRAKQGAVLHDKDKVVAQCLLLAERGEIKTVEGTIIKSTASSICLHGDNENALDLAINIKKSLEKAGIRIHSCL
ncbi:MAG: LamB/YcsF family protein [Devosiaceae bacterium]|nr:LamB/YcsF family protein [Devosiaceae bacterium]